MLSIAIVDLPGAKPRSFYSLISSMGKVPSSLQSLLQLFFHPREDIVKVVPGLSVPNVGQLQPVGLFVQALEQGREPLVTHGEILLDIQICLVRQAFQGKGQERYGDRNRADETRGKGL